MTLTDERPAAPPSGSVRALAFDSGDELRAAALDDDGRTLHGYFAVFNRWTEIDSAWEGRFLERIAPGAFADVFASGRDVKVLYDHGHDPQLGNKPLGPIRSLEEDKVGARYEVGLIDTDYNDRFVIPAASAGLLGASFRFKVPADGEEWVDPKRATKHNPANLPERTITRVDPLYEFGPVTFPAYPDGTTAGVRSMTDDYLDWFLHDPLFLARFTERAGLSIVEPLLTSLSPPSERHDEDPDDSTAGQTPQVPKFTPRPRRTLEDLRADRLILETRLAAVLGKDRR